MPGYFAKSLEPNVWRGGHSHQYSKVRSLTTSDGERLALIDLRFSAVCLMTQTHHHLPMSRHPISTKTTGKSTSSACVRLSRRAGKTRGPHMWYWLFLLIVFYSLLSVWFICGRLWRNKYCLLMSKGDSILSMVADTPLAWLVLEDSHAVWWHAQRGVWAPGTYSPFGLFLWIIAYVSVARCIMHWLMMFSASILSCCLLVFSFPLCFTLT